LAFTKRGGQRKCEVQTASGNLRSRKCEGQEYAFNRKKIVGTNNKDHIVFLPALKYVFSKVLFSSDVLKVIFIAVRSGSDSHLYDWALELLTCTVRLKAKLEYERAFKRQDLTCI